MMLLDFRNMLDIIIKNRIFCVMFLYLQLHEASSQYQLFDVTPQNSYVYVDKAATMNCRIKDSANSVQVWTEYISNSKGSVIARNGVIQEAYTSRFQVTSTSDNSLRVFSAQSADSGIYSCKKDGDNEENAYYVYLVVIMFDPVITSSPLNTSVIEGTTITFTCEFAVSGSWFPNVYWIGSNGEKLTGETIYGAGSNKLQLITELKNDKQEFGCVIIYKVPPWVGQRYKDTSSLQYTKPGLSDVITVLPNGASDAKNEVKNGTTRVAGQQSRKHGSNGGGIALGIVIGLLIIGGLAVGMYFGYNYYRKWKKNKQSFNEASNAESGDHPIAQSTQNGSVLQRLKQSVKNLTSPDQQKFHNLTSSAATMNNGMPRSDAINMAEIRPSQETSYNNSRQDERTEPQEMGAGGDLGNSSSNYNSP